MTDRCTSLGTWEVCVHYNGRTGCIIPLGGCIILRGDALGGVILTCINIEEM
jgi:hypothetical protein